jgi:plasmid maintenance system killer protein
VIRQPFGRQAAKALTALSTANRERAAKAIRQFDANPRHPSLHFERLQGHKNRFSIRISRSHRAILQCVEGEGTETYELLDVSVHDIYRRM